MTGSVAAVAATDYPNLADFGHDPWWLMIIKALAVFVFLVANPLVAILVERKIMARMQARLGPNRVGPRGILQSLADGVKLALKEGLTPAGVDKIIYLLAPIIAVVPAIVAFAVIPFGPMVSIFGHQTPLQLTDLPVAVLFILAMASIGVYGIVLAGWSSGSTYPLLGGLRSTAQVISYEIAMGLTFAAVFLDAGTMSTSEIVAGQHNYWYGLVLLPSFVIYAVSMVGETNRAPFDLPEAEGELVGGFHTEYSSLKFAMFMLAEYINMVTVSALATTLFLGGWQAPWPLSLWAGANSGWWPILWFTIKVWVFMFVFIWLRTSLPRLRYDQFMNLGWKVLIPVSLAWVMVVALIRAAFDTDATVARALTSAAVGILVTLFLMWLVRSVIRPNRPARPAAPTVSNPDPITAVPATAASTQSAPTRPFDAMAGGFPVPPLPGQVADSPSAEPPSARTSSTEPPSAPAKETTDA